MEEIRTIIRKAHALATNIPNTVIVFQDTTAHKVKPIERVNECLAGRRIACEWANAQLATRNGQVKGLSGCRLEPNVNLGRQRGNFRACDSISSWLSAERFNVGRDNGVDSLK